MPEPLALEMVAATIPDHDLRILDMRVEDSLAATLKQFAPDMVVVTALTTEVYAAQDVMKAAKDFSGEIFTVIGGIHASLLPEDFHLPYVDAIAAGEAELNFPRLVEAVGDHKPLKNIPDLIWQDADGEFVRNPSGPMKLDMDKLPMPRRDLIEHNRGKYFWLFSKPDIAMATGRGCPFRCNGRC